MKSTMNGMRRLGKSPTQSSEAERLLSGATSVSANIIVFKIIKWGNNIQVKASQSKSKMEVKASQSQALKSKSKIKVKERRLEVNIVIC